MAAPLTGYSFTHVAVSLPAPFVAHIEINRPAKLNAFSRPVWLDFGAAFRQLSADPDVRAVVLSGAGDRAFTAGLDIVAAGQDEDGVLGNGPDNDVARRAKTLRAHIAEFQGCISAVEECEKPVVVVLHDIAIGLAIDIACCADVRLCTKNARMAVKEVDIGLAADIGTLGRLPKIVGSTSWVKDVCLTARDIPPEEALRVGFVSAVLDSKQTAVATALEMAKTMAEKSPVAIQGTKEILNHARDHSVAENLHYTKIWNSAALQSEDLKKALMSSMTKKKPKFSKL